VTTGKPLAKVRAQGYSGPTMVAFSPDGTLAAVAGWNAIELVDPRTGESKQLLLGRSGVGRALAFSPDGTTLFATRQAGVVQRWRTADGERLSTTEPPAPQLHLCAVRALSADRGVAWAVESSAVVAWEVPSGKLLGPRAGHVGAVQRVAVTPDSKFALTCAYGQSLKWELASGKLLGPAPGHPWPGQSTGLGLVEFGPGGVKALLNDFGNYALHDGTTGMQEYVIPISQPNIHRATFTADGAKVITCEGSSDGKREPAVVAVWDVAAAKRLLSLQLTNHLMPDAGLTPDGKRLITVSRKPAEKAAGDFLIQVWDLRGTKKREYSEPAGYGYGTVATAGDNESAAVVTSKGALVHFELATGKVKSVASGIDQVSQASVFSPDGQLLAVLGQSSFGRPAPVVVIEWATGKVRHSFSCPDGGPISAAFSPDGRYLVTGTQQTTALVWELTK
jgi:WD40 repeat protein